MNDRQKTVVLTKALNHLTTGAALKKISSSVMQVKVAEDLDLNIGRQAVFKQLKARGLIQASPTKSHKRKIPLPPAKPKPPLPEPKNIPPPRRNDRQRQPKSLPKSPRPKSASRLQRKPQKPSEGSAHNRYKRESLVTRAPQVFVNTTHYQESIVTVHQKGGGGVKNTFINFP